MPEVVIKDPVLKRAMKKLSKKLLVKELARKRTLECPRSSGKAMRRLDGIEVCNSLTKLDLSGHELVDISPLGGLVKLKSLHLYSNEKLEDIAALAGMHKLEVLYLSITAVHDMSPLSSLSALSYLSISETPVEDISPLEGLAALETVILRDCPRLIIEDGNKNHTTVKGLLQRGVDVYIKGNESVDDLKSALGIALS